jgi:hypothetical protein
MTHLPYSKVPPGLTPTPSAKPPTQNRSQKRSIAQLPVARLPVAQLPVTINSSSPGFQLRRGMVMASARLASLTTATPESWLQRRLRLSLKRDRVFFKLIRKKAQQAAQRAEGPSRLHQRLSVKQARHRKVLGGLTLAVGLAVAGFTWGSLFVGEQVTLGGVPYRVVDKFLRDDVAKGAYFAGDRQALHDRLLALGVEEDIKAYYRDRFNSEPALDLYIHQLMFDRTGYVGEAYEVDGYGHLKARAY